MIMSTYSNSCKYTVDYYKKTIDDMQNEKYFYGYYNEFCI